MSAGQLVEDVRLAVEGRAPVFFHGRTGGMVPTPADVVGELRRAWARTIPIDDPARAAEAADEPDPLSFIEQGAWLAAGIGR